MKRQRWEYITIEHRLDQYNSSLDTLGEDGWEMVAVVPDPHDSEDCFVYFKRPVGPAENE
jgi:hypothetical protein